MRPIALLGYLACAISVFWITQQAPAQSAFAELPTLADLKATSYQRTAQPDLASVPTYQDLMNTIRLAEAYSRGKRLLPNYHEPILTRGTSGIGVFRNVAPSVVLVVVGEVKNNEFEPSGLGAGVIINSSGDILTNWHVINGYSAALIFLKPPGGATMLDAYAYGARLIAQNETVDLALLRIAKPPSNLEHVSIGSISSVQVAEDIHVIGHPKGNLWSYTTGVVSQVRDGYDWTYSDGSKHEAKVLQLQTAINPGNSGGPVLDDQGKLLGLVAMGEEGQNLNYAIAADVIQSFLLRTASTSTRGGATEANPPGAEYSSGRLQDDRAILKVTYPDLIEYVVSDAKGKILGLVAEASNGTRVRAWESNSFSGFKEWEISLPGGTSVRARGSAEAPDQFSSN